MTESAETAVLERAVPIMAAAERRNRAKAKTEETAEEKERKESIGRLLEDGAHIVDSRRAAGICPTTGDETPRGRYEPISSCRSCNRADIHFVRVV